MAIKIEYSIDRMGCLRMRPVNQRLNKAIGKYLEEWKVAWSGDVFVQEDFNIEAALEGFTETERRDLDNGWSVTKLEDPWTWLHYVGWDAHEGVRKW